MTSCTRKRSSISQIWKQNTLDQQKTSGKCPTLSTRNHSSSTLFCLGACPVLQGPCTSAKVCGASAKSAREDKTTENVWRSTKCNDNFWNLKHGPEDPRQDSVTHMEWSHVLRRGGSWCVSANACSVQRVSLEFQPKTTKRYHSHALTRDSRFVNAQKVLWEVARLVQLIHTKNGSFPRSSSLVAPVLALHQNSTQQVFAMHANKTSITRAWRWTMLST